MKRIVLLVACLALIALLLGPSATVAKKLKPIKLVEPQTEGGRPLMQVLKDRSSSRSFSAEQLPPQVLSNLLWAAFGINRPESGKRTAPSALNWQEIDIYVATADGLYLYDAQVHALEPVLAQDIRAATGRQSFVGKVHLDFGGDGVAVELIPFAGIEATGSDFSNFDVDLNQSVGGGLGGDYVALGLEASLVYRFSAKTFYPHIGFGCHGGYLISDEIEYGAEIYARLPMGFTWYMAEHFALVFEFNLMYGVTGIRGKTTDIMAELKAEFEQEYENFDSDEFDPENPPEDLSEEDQRRALRGMLEAKLAEQIKFGAGLAFDVLIGVRFP